MCLHSGFTSGIIPFGFTQKDWIMRVIRRVEKHTVVNNKALFAGLHPNFQQITILKAQKTAGSFSCQITRTTKYFMKGGESR